MPWIKNAFALLHNSCSTAVEAAVAGTPIITYAPFKRKYLQNKGTNWCTTEYQVDDEDLFKLLSIHI